MAIRKEVTLEYAGNGRLQGDSGFPEAFVSIDCKDVGAELLRLGWAVPDRQSETDRLEEYAKLCKDAQNDKVGMWE
jgi:endonuclease YncB( thermonuclease family)